MTHKSTVEDIRQRFDNDVERFSNLDTGQAATMDAPLTMALATQAAASVTPHARDVLDIGCGAGNYSLKLLEQLPGCNVTLIDLSANMLAASQRRVSAATTGHVNTRQGDVRQLDLGDQQYDIVVAAAVLHHLRTDDEWRAVFSSVHRALRPSGSFWIVDLVTHSSEAVHAMMWQRYGDYLTDLRDAAYRDHVFAYIEREDTPRSLMEQLDLLRRVGFVDVDVLHKNNCFAAFGGMRA
jgi:tRNA (cmo5U34)-methyltransferase